MGDLVNLRRARKAKARVDAEAQAAENRARFGVSKAARRQGEAQAALETRRLDQHRRDEPGKA